MRPLTFGVLSSVGPARFAVDAFRGSEPSSAAAADLRRADRALESAIDVQSAADLVGALHRLGHAAELVAVDSDIDMTLRQTEVDACLLALHGRAGGTGEIQALLAARQIPYVGPSAAAVGLAFDKVRARQMLAYHNVPVLPAVAIGRDMKTHERALALLGWPCVLKPRRAAHGLGVTLLTDPTQVRTAIERALDLDHELVLERATEGTEVQVVLLGDRVLGAAEIVGRSERAPGDQILPPRLSRARLDGIGHIARRAVAALGLHDGVTRVDLMVSERHNEVVLEVEPLPVLSRDGVVARVAKAAGIAYDALVAMLTDRLVLRVPESRTTHESAVYLQ